MKQTNNNIRIYLPILIAVAVVLGIVIGLSLSRKQIVQENMFLMPKSDKLNSVMRYINEEYVDTVDLSKLNEEAINAILKKLDPHSVYIPAEDVTAVNEPLEGNFSGIGVEFNMPQDTVVIINTIPNGPSALLGIMPGDRIIKVNGKNVAGIKLPSDSIVKKLKGPRGTHVSVTILRRPNKTLVFDITRDKIPLYSIDVAYMADSSTGYIKINQFARTTYSEFTDAVNKLKNEGMKGIIIDLRSNGGGFLDEAINLADEFLPNGQLIVYTKGKSHPRENYYASNKGSLEKIKISILIDEFSASASEILSGAIQDNDRGTIIGRRSFGKGLVQEPIVFADQSMIRLTVARYYTPTGRCIQRSYSNGTDDYYADIYSRFAHKEMLTADSIKFNDSLKYTTPAGKIVYGGGGIMPDIFIPIDTTGMTPYFDEVRDNGLIYRFAFEYSDNNRAKLNTFKDYKELLAYLEINNIVDLFVKYSEANGFKPNVNEIEISKQLLSTYLNAYIVRNFFKNEGYYPVIGAIDNTLTRALEEMRK